MIKTKLIKEDKGGTAFAPIYSSLDDNINCFIKTEKIKKILHIALGSYQDSLGEAAQALITYEAEDEDERT